MAVRFSRHSGSRASLSWLVRRCVPRALSLTRDPRPSRITRNSYRRKVSDRTMVANLTTCCFAGFGTKRLRCDDTMKTPERGTLNRWATTLSNRAHGCGRSEQILLKHVGCEPRKDPAAGGVFFLTSPFIELTRVNRVAEWQEQSRALRCPTSTRGCT